MKVAVFTRQEAAAIPAQLRLVLFIRVRDAKLDAVSNAKLLSSVKIEAKSRNVATMNDAETVLFASTARKTLAQVRFVLPIVELLVNPTIVEGAKQSSTYGERNWKRRIASSKRRVLLAPVNFAHRARTHAKTQSARDILMPSAWPSDVKCARRYFTIKTYKL